MSNCQDDFLILIKKRRKVKAMTDTEVGALIKNKKSKY